MVAEIAGLRCSRSISCFWNTIIGLSYWSFLTKINPLISSTMFRTTSLLSRSVKSARFFTASAPAAQGPVIGFIGLGNMGHGMVKNILLAPANIQRKVIVYDIDQEKLRSTVELGAVEASDVKSLAQQSDVIISILPTSQCVLSVLGGADGVFANAKPGSMIIESSTIDPLTADALHKSALDHKLRMLDSPVSGGRVGAEAGTLTFIVGGSDENFESARVSLPCFVR